MDDTTRLGDATRLGNSLALDGILRSQKSEVGYQMKES